MLSGLRSLTLSLLASLWRPSFWAAHNITTPTDFNVQRLPRFSKTKTRALAAQLLRRRRTGARDNLAGFAQSSRVPSAKAWLVAGWWLAGLSARRACALSGESWRSRGAGGCVVDAPVCAILMRG